MTPEEAIEILEDYVKPTGFIPHDDFPDAIKFGIEALKRELEWRRRHPHQSHLPFPGETEERS